jgi:hypothetical protein
MNKKEVLEVIENYEQQLKLPTTDVLSNGCQKLVQALSDQFPKLKQIIKLENSKLFVNKKINRKNRLEGIDEFVHA